MGNWTIAAKKADFNGIAERFHIDPVTARLIRNRDIVGDDAIETYLHGGRECLHAPEALKGMDRAVAIVKEKIGSGEKIRIIGDYDIDGVMSTYILYSGLRRAGAQVDYAIPNRITDGYGVNIDLIREAKADGAGTIITCDNGIAAIEQTRYAREQGMTMLITDHHEIAQQETADGRRIPVLPEADALINPKQPGCTYPFKELCGAAVAFKLICALYKALGISAEEQEAFLPYVAFATIGDVVDLVGENRILVREGLPMLRQTDNPGLLALMRENGMEPQDLSVYHIGFVLGPCLNAGGRLDTAVRSLKLLLSRDSEEAAQLAGDLKALNDSRKEMTLQGAEEAQRLVETTDLAQDKVLVVYLPDCHESLAGIIAGRLREKYYKPAFVLTRTQDGGVKGSGRSIEPYSMFEEMGRCADLLEKYGGHPMAAGLSMREEDIPMFRQRLNEAAPLTPDDLTEHIHIDIAMPIHYIRPELVEEFSLLEPFGKGNRKPLFAQKDLRILTPRVLGKKGNVVRMQVQEESGCTMDAVYFGDGARFCADLADRGTLTVTYYPRIDTYQGRNKLQIVIQQYR